MHERTGSGAGAPFVAGPDLSPGHRPPRREVHARHLVEPARALAPFHQFVAEQGEHAAAIRKSGEQDRYRVEHSRKTLRTWAREVEKGGDRFGPLHLTAGVGVADHPGEALRSVVDVLGISGYLGQIRTPECMPHGIRVREVPSFGFLHYNAELRGGWGSYDRRYSGVDVGHPSLPYGAHVTVVVDQDEHTVTGASGRLEPHAELLK